MIDTSILPDPNDLSVQHVSWQLQTYVFLCRELLDDTDSRVAYYSSAFLLKARGFLKFTILILERHTLEERYVSKYIFGSPVKIWIISEDDDGGTREISKHASEACL